MTLLQHLFAPGLAHLCGARWRLAATLMLLAGCGGGVGTGGTGSFSYTSGPITGFGSIVVNDVRFDESSARIEDADGVTRRGEDLRLGMTVEVEGSEIQGAAANATRVRLASELLGPVASVNRGAGSFNMLGQTVLVDATTVFDERLAGGLAGLSSGTVVEVYALFDVSTQRYRATRVEPAGASDGYRLRGMLAAVDGGARMATMGGAQFAYAAAAGVPSGLAPGQFVRLRVQPGMMGPSSWTVLGFGSALSSPPEQALAKIKGLVSAFNSLASFSVNGQPVNGAAASFPNGMALGPGVRVEVEGSVQAGVLQATRVTIESEQMAREHGFEVKGAISAVSSEQRSFVVRGVTISTTRSDLRVDNGSLADLAVGRQVEVKGLLSADGTRLEATRLKFN